MSELLVSALEPDLVLTDRYRVRHKIGDGAVASVYCATDERAGGEVALKILDPIRGADPVGRQRFLREVELLARLDHPAIARCLRVERHLDLEFMVLELVEGETLAARLARGRLSVGEATAIATRAADALSACHAAGVIHRDLKPANVMLHPERGAVLLDFGVAWFSGAANLTRTGAVVGSPQYIAPEVFSSSLHDARSDVYALGVLLFEMLAGQPPYKADSVPALVELHRQGAPPSLMSLRAEVPSALARVVMRAIETLPEARYATAEELQSALAGGDAAPARELVVRLPCASCGTPRIIDLPFCPGCGAEVSWQLLPGACAVQLAKVPDPKAAAAWIRERHSYAYSGLDAHLVRRFSQFPVPLIVNVAESSATQLATEARALGMVAQVFQASTIAGARFDIRAASFVEMMAALALHYAAVTLIALGAIVLGLDLASVVAGAPAVIGVLGIAAAYVYNRRPILRIPRSSLGAVAHARHARLRERLSRLRNARARRLAAGAVARAAPALLGDVAGLPSIAGVAVNEALERALVAVEAVDGHLDALMGTSRARLGSELAAAEARIERGVAGAEDERAEVLGRQQAHVDAAVAHDLAVREVLEASREISATMSARTLEVPETDWGVS